MKCSFDPELRTSGSDENCFARAFGGAGGTCECPGLGLMEVMVVVNAGGSPNNVMGHSPFLCFLQEQFFGE